MSLGTIDRTPPRFFRQGPSALTKLSVCSALAVFLMVADTRLSLTRSLRTVVATVLHPVERVLRVPVDAWNGSGDYLMGLQRALSSESAARLELARQAERAAHVEQLLVENNRLRALLELRPSLTVRFQAAEVLYDAPDPFSRKVILDHGAAHNVQLSSPVINEAGVLGQVTRVYPLSSEVTLLSDKDAAIPVLNPRTQVRSVAFGRAAGEAMELRFLAGNADVQVGDELFTSGVDGVYPPGLKVARVAAIDRTVETGFARIVLAPAAPFGGVRHVLVLDPVGLQMPPRPEPVLEETKRVMPKKSVGKVTKPRNQGSAP